MILNLVVTSLVLGLMLIFGHKWSKRGTVDLTAVQSSHRQVTVRFGGVAVIFGLSSIIFTDFLSSVVISLLISGLPIFTAGLLEDISGKIRPRNRLLAAFLSAGLAVFLTGMYLNYGDFWFLDKLFVIPIVAIPITILISSGIANSFNIIDGVNGFSASVALVIACVLGSICHSYNEPQLSYFCYMIAIACIPFLLVNFPFGLIFLGDAGAYTLGHLLSWVAIILIYRHPEISAWAMLLIFFWPATETLLSIYRRFMSKMPSAAPDSFHFHQIIMQLLQLKFSTDSKFNVWANPFSTLILLPLAVIPILVSLIVIKHNIFAVLIYLTLVAGYFLLYLVLLKKLKSVALASGRHDLANRLKYVFKPSKK